MDQFNDNSETKDILGGARVVRPSDPDTYSDPDSARVRARQLGCIGIRRYNNRNGGVSWMPCTNESDYRKYSGIGFSGRKYRRTQLEREVREIIGSPSKRKFKEKSANYTKPELRDRLKERIMSGSKGGAPGQWSARKAQLLAAEYRKAGGGYKGGKSKPQRSLNKWTKEKWRTIDGKPAKRGNVVRRYLPAKAWNELTVGERAATNRKKIEGSKLGERVVLNTRKAAKARKRATRGQKHIEFYDELDFKAVRKKLGGGLGGGLAGRIGVGEVENRGRSTRRAMGRVGAIVEPFDQHARDADADGVVQEGTIHERPAIPGVNPIGPVDKPNIPSVKPTERLTQRITEDRVNLPRREPSEQRVRREISRGQEVAKKPVRIERAKPDTSRREAERVIERKPINTPTPAVAVYPTNAPTEELKADLKRELASEKPDQDLIKVINSELESRGVSNPDKLQQTARKLGMEADRARALKESYDDFSNQLNRQEKNKIYQVWQDGEYSLDELADQFDVVRDEIATVLRNHQQFRDDNEKEFKKNNEKLSRAIESRMGVSREPIQEAVREGKIKNWDSLLNWVFRSPDSKKNNKHGELESDLFRAFPSGSSPEKTTSKFVLGVRETNRNNRRGYVRDIADLNNKPNGFRQLSEMQRTADSAFEGSSSRWNNNERASNARSYRETSRANDIGRMWDSGITGAMSTGPNMTPQEESDWKQREWKRQQLKNLVLMPDRDTKLPSLSKALQGDDIARAISGLDLLTDQAVDDLFDKTQIEMFDAGSKMPGYRAAFAPPSPRELAAAANIKRPLVKDFIEEYKITNPSGNIARLDPDNMSDKEIDGFFNTFIIPGLINANNPTSADIKAAVMEPQNAESLSLAEDVMFGIADEYQDLEFRTMLAKRMLKDNGLSTSDPNFDNLVNQMIDKEIDKDIANGLASIEGFLDNIPSWLGRSAEELFNPRTGLPYKNNDWADDVGDVGGVFEALTESVLNGEPIDPILALAVQEELNRLIDAGQANGWLPDDMLRPEYPSRTRRIDNNDDNENPLNELTDGTPNENMPAENAPDEGAPDEGAPNEGAPNEGATGENAPDEGEFHDGSEESTNNLVRDYLNDLLDYGHRESEPVIEDKYGILDTPEVWNEPVYDENGNLVAGVYDGSDDHPLNLDENGNPLDVTKLQLLEPQHYNYIKPDHVLHEWTDIQDTSSQAYRYFVRDTSQGKERVDEIGDNFTEDPNDPVFQRLIENLAVTPTELEDAFYANDINSPDALDIDQTVATGLDRLMDVIASDNPEWFTKDASGNLIGDLNEITKSGTYNAAGVPRFKFNAEDYTATQAKIELKAALEAAVKEEHDSLNNTTPAAVARREELWELFALGTLSADEIAFDENLLDTQNLISALKRYAVENNISTAQYNTIRKVADTAAVGRADAFTQKRIQRIKDDFTNQGLQPKDWVKAIDEEINKQKSLKAKLDTEYRRFRADFARKQILVREIFATRPPNRIQSVKRDGTIIPGWDKTKESASQYLNRIRRWDRLHIGTPEKPGVLSEILKNMSFSSRIDGRDGASGATARIAALADRNISELQNLRSEYSRIKGQANQYGISGFMRLGGREAEFYDSARLAARDAGRRAAYGNFDFVPPSVLRKYDKAGLPISRAVRNSASGFNRSMASEISDATNNGITPVENKPGFRYLSPKLQRIAKIVSDFADKTKSIKVLSSKKSNRTQTGKNQIKDAISPDIAARLYEARAASHNSRLTMFNPPKLSNEAKRIYGSGITGQMQTWTDKFKDGKWYITDKYGRKISNDGYVNHRDAIDDAKIIQLQNHGEPTFPITDGVMREAARLNQTPYGYMSERNIELDVTDSTSAWVLGNDSKPMQEAGDAVILRTNPDTGQREILLIERLFGPHTAQSNALSLPGGMKEADEQLRDTAKREALEEVNVTSKDIVRMGHLGEIEARDWDPRFVNGAKISGVVLEVSPDTQIKAGDDAATAAWYSLSSLASGERPLAFGHAAWIASALAGTDDEVLHDKFVNLNAISRRRQQRIISAVNAKRSTMLDKDGKKLKLFPTSMPNPDSGYIPSGRDAEIHLQRIREWARDKRNGGVTGAMGARYFRGPITSWSSDNLTTEERNKIMQDVIEMRKKEFNPVTIARALNNKWDADNFMRKDGYIHSFNPQQVKDVVYKARMDGVKFDKLRGEKTPIEVQSAENIKHIAQRSFVGGHSAEDIANELDISAGEVIKVQRAIGLSSINNDMNKARRRDESSKVLELIGNGKSFKEAGQELGITEAVARNRYKAALSSGSISGKMNVDSIPFSKFVEMSREAETLRKTNADAFYYKTYERISNVEIAKTLGIKTSEVDDAVKNHLNFIENNKNEILATYEEAFKNSRKNLTPAENRHMKMRFDGMSINQIAELEGTDVIDALTNESIILAKIKGQNRSLFETKMGIKERDLIDAPINSKRGTSKRIYVSVVHDGLDIEKVAKSEGITPAQVRENLKKYSDALDKTDNFDKKLLRKAVVLNDANLNDSQKQFINMRLDGVSIRDMAHLENKDVVDVKIDQRETMNRFNSGGITGAMGFPRKQYKDNDYYDILGVDENVSEKELRTAYRKAARETHPDLHPGDKANEELFKKLNEAYSVLSDPEERSYYDSVRPIRRQPRRQEENIPQPPKRPTADNSGNPFPIVTTLSDDLSYTDPATGKRVPDWYVREQQGLPPRWPTNHDHEDVKMGDITNLNRNPHDGIFPPDIDNGVPVESDTEEFFTDGSGPGTAFFKFQRRQNKKRNRDQGRKPGSGEKDTDNQSDQGPQSSGETYQISGMDVTDEDLMSYGLIHRNGGAYDKNGEEWVFSGYTGDWGPLADGRRIKLTEEEKQRFRDGGITGFMSMGKSSSAEINKEKRAAESKTPRWTDEEINSAEESGENLKGNPGITGRMTSDSTRKALEELMKDANEPLDEDLEAFIDTNNDLGMPIVRHPLVIWVGPIVPGIINKQYRQKLEAVADARKEKKWSSYINLHERPYRLDAFMDVKDEMTDSEYWSSLADVWVDSENIWQNQDIWKSVLSSKRPNRINMMNKDEQKEFASLPNELTIYRGYIKGKNKNGLSWTTDKDKAEWFSTRLAGRGDNPVVQQATVNKKDVVAYFSRRGESEVVVAKTPKITGSMNVGPSEELISRREEREMKVGKASDALDRILAENPTKYKNLKKSAVSVYNAVTAQNVKEQNIIDTPEEAIAKFVPSSKEADRLEKEFTISKNIKQHLLIKRMMAELMSDFSVDKDGNLKGTPGSHVSDEKNIARRKFNNRLSDMAKEVISKNELLKKRGRPAGQAGQLASTPEENNRVNETILDLLKKGKTKTQIADYLQISRQALSNRLKRLGLIEPRITPEERASRNKKIAELYAVNPDMTRLEIAENLGISLESVKEGLKTMGASKKSGPKKGRTKKGKNAVSGITGAMGLFDKITNKNPEEPEENSFHNRPPFVKVNLPKMDDSVSKRIGFSGKLTDYKVENYTSNYPQSTIGTFIARGDEPFVALDATFGGTTKIKEDRFWDLYQPIAVALSKSVTRKRKDGEPKRFISVGGAPGSGKSTLRFSGKHDIPLADEAIHIDADEMKTLIPEAVEMHRNGNPHWADASHEESRIMADVALKVGLENDHDIVYDSTGQFNSGFGTLKEARQRGYEIVMHYNVAPENVLNERIDEREKKDPRRLPRHIIRAVNQRNFDIMPTVAKGSDEFYLWDTDVPTGTEPVLLARKLKGGNLEILDAKAYAHGDFDPTGQAIDMSKPDFKINPRKVGRDTYHGQIISDYENGKSVAEIAEERKTTVGNVFDSITKHEIDDTIPNPVAAPPQRPNPNVSNAPRALTSESLTDTEAMNQFRSLSSADKAILKDFIAKKPGVSLDQMTERVPMDLVIWASAQKPEHIQPMGQVRSIEKLESLSPSKRQQLTDMLQGGESVIDIANALNIPFAVIDVAMDFVDQYGYIPEAGDTEEKSVLFGMVSGNRISRLIGKTIKASIVNGVVINER